MSDREIVASNGVVISLTEAETAVMTSMFASVVEGNEVADYLAAHPTEDPYANCGWGGPCPELRDLSSDVTRSRSSEWAPLNRSGNVKIRSAPPKRRGRGAPERPVRPNAASGDVGIASAQVNSLEIGPCWDLWISIYEGTIAFRAVEAELNEALSNLATSAELTWEDGRWKVGVGDWQLQYITILTLQAELLQKKLSLDVLATWYHSNNCDQTPFGPPNGWDGNISGGTQIQLVCWQENDWEISYDGGLTWEPLGMPVTVCEYRPAMS